jgi:hypothetical protein
MMNRTLPSNLIARSAASGSGGVGAASGVAVGPGPGSVAVAARSPPSQLSSIPLPAISSAPGLIALSASLQSLWVALKKFENPSPSPSKTLRSSGIVRGPIKVCSVTAISASRDG